MTPQQFEAVLGRAADLLTESLRTSDRNHGPDQFNKGVIDMLRVAAQGTGVKVEPTFHRNAFPDIRVNGFGVEAKYSKRDTWHTVANSIFEGMRDRTVERIYVMFGKGGGAPEVRWSRYEDCVTHVRTSNAPRFVVDLNSDEPPLFERFDITYDDFSKLDDEGKMEHVREYWRDRLKPGERLWWLQPDHALPLEVRLYTNLAPDEKRLLRAEAALMCPKLVRNGYVRGKYADAAVYALTQWGVLCPQARDLFSAGSVAERIDPLHPGELYISRAMRGIEYVMVDRAQRLDDALFVEYWGESCAPSDRLRRWLEMADEWATDWQPSAVLFRWLR